MWKRLFYGTGISPGSRFVSCPDELIRPTRDFRNLCGSASNQAGLVGVVSFWPRPSIWGAVCLEAKMRQYTGSQLAFSFSTKAFVMMLSDKVVRS